jgi:hypothetical protein
MRPSRFLGCPSLGVFLTVIQRSSSFLPRSTLRSRLSLSGGRNTLRSPKVFLVLPGSKPVLLQLTAADFLLVKESSQVRPRSSPRPRFGLSADDFLRHPKPFHDHLHDHPITLRAFWWPQHSTTSPPSYLSAVHPASFLSFWWPLYSDPSAIRPRSVLLYDVTYGIWHMTYDTQNGARTRTERHSTVLGTALCFT